MSENSTKMNRHQRRALGNRKRKTEHNEATGSYQLAQVADGLSELVLPTAYIAARDKQIWEQAVSETRQRYSWLMHAQARALDAFYRSHAFLNEIVQLLVVIDHLPDHVIKSALSGKIEGVTGTFNELIYALEALGTRLSDKNSHAYEFIDEVTKALDAVQTGRDPRANALHEIFSQYTEISSTIEAVVRGSGRDSGMDALTFHLGQWGNRLISADGLSYKDAAERILNELNTMPASNLSFAQKMIQGELSRRDKYTKTQIENPDTGHTETLETRQNYLKGVVHRYRHGNSRKSFEKV